MVTNRATKTTGTETTPLPLPLTTALCYITPHTMHSASTYINIMALALIGTSNIHFFLLCSQKDSGDAPATWLFIWATEYFTFVCVRALTKSLTHKRTVPQV